jgi:hypothetical protein
MFETVVVVIWAGSTVSASMPTAIRKVPAAPAGAATAITARQMTTASPRQER